MWDLKAEIAKIRAKIKDTDKIVVELKTLQKEGKYKDSNTLRKKYKGELEERQLLLDELHMLTSKWV